MVSNKEFLQTLFGVDHVWVHVTSFHDDPSNISNENRYKCWGGDYYSRTSILPNSNQYFTISTFYADDKNKARRRKALFRCTHVIVADDVREKLDIDQVRRLPAPTYKLLTSPGSEQWGWILDHPCSERHKVENLLDGLVAKGLAPSGKDPGMKGVTRYVRLPEGVNTKASKIVNGLPQRCVMLEWSPLVKVSIESLAEPFGVDLNAERREGRVDGASKVDDHPLVNIPDIIKIKEVRSDGRYDITCPWVNEHTGAADDGAAVFTNDDGSIGFKCHHGACEQRTGKELLEFIESHKPGFRRDMETWKMLRVFGAVNDRGQVKDKFGFMNVNNSGGTQVTENTQDKISGYQDLIDKLRTLPAGNDETVQMSYQILKAVDNLDHGSRLKWWDQVRDYMDWTKPDLQSILTQQRSEWYKKKNSDFYKEFVYVAEQNQFYNQSKRMWLTAEAFQNAYSHIDEAARFDALVGGKVRKVDRFDYSPGDGDIFNEKGVTFVNGWVGDIEQGVPGDVSRWLNHFDVLGWQDHKEHILKWMAFTLRHPERKINHILLLSGGEGNGKDFLLDPLVRAFGQDAKSIEGDELLKNFNDYILSTKYLHVNETELGDRQGASAVTNKLKPLAANPPYTLRADPKGIRPITIKNVFNVSMTSNSAMPLKLTSDSRRYYAVWTDVTVRGKDRQVTPEWRKYWADRWYWMRDCEGWKHCVHYLMTQVDLSDYDPGMAPIVTDFVKDIQTASEDPLVSLLKEFIDEKLSLFAADLLSMKDISIALKSAQMFDVSIDLKNTPSPQVIGKVLKQSGIGRNVKAWKGSDHVRLWVIRNHELYEGKKGSELYNIYQAQMLHIKNESTLSLVK